MPTVACLYCEAELKAPVEYRGRTVKCAVCGKSFLLRFTNHDLSCVAVKVFDRPSEPPPELKSTVSFRLPDSSDSSPDTGLTGRAFQTPVPAKPSRKTPHRKK